MTAPPGGDDVGSLLEEAVKLARAIAEDAARPDAGDAQARAAGDPPDPGTADAGEGEARRPGAGDDARSRTDGGSGTSHGATTCAYCPLCQLIAVLRDARPDVAEHLASATASLALALRGVVDSFSQPPGSGAGEHGRDRGVQDIDLEDGGWD